MIFYHGSHTFGLTVLEPVPMEFEKPCVLLSTLEIVGGFHMVNAVEPPYCWFPYGFDGNGVPQYHELYPNALREVSEGRKGCIYTVDADENELLPLNGVPDGRLSTVPLKVADCLEVSDCYEWLMNEEAMGSFRLCRYEEKTPAQLRVWYNSVLRHVVERKMIKTPDCSYAKFVQEKFPKVWESYEKLCAGTK